MPSRGKAAAIPDKWFMEGAVYCRSRVLLLLVANRGEEPARAALPCKPM